jgi:hypothetical protein
MGFLTGDYRALVDINQLQTPWAVALPTQTVEPDEGGSTVATVVSTTDPSTETETSGRQVDVAPAVGAVNIMATHGAPGEVNAAPTAAAPVNATQSGQGPQLITETTLPAGKLFGVVGQDAATRDYTWRDFLGGLPRAEVLRAGAELVNYDIDYVILDPDNKTMPPTSAKGKNHRYDWLAHLVGEPRWLQVPAVPYDVYFETLWMRRGRCHRRRRQGAHEDHANTCSGHLARGGQV